MGSRHTLEAWVQNWYKTYIVLKLAGHVDNQAMSQSLYYAFVHIKKEERGEGM